MTLGGILEFFLGNTFAFVVFCSFGKLFTISRYPFHLKSPLLTLSQVGFGSLSEVHSPHSTMRTAPTLRIPPSPTKGLPAKDSMQASVG